MTLNITTNGNEVTGKFSGRLDTAAAQQLTVDIQPLLDNADKHIILDCNELSFISSSGLRLFLSLRKATIAKGGDVTIIGMSADIKQVFTLTGFLNLFKIQ